MDPGPGGAAAEGLIPRIFALGRLQGLRSFAVVYISQVLSVFGSELTGFALGVWIYRETESATAFALLAFFMVIPEIAMAPIAGALVDRWDRRLALIASDMGAGLGTVVLVCLALSGRLEIWHVYPIVALGAAFRALQFPAIAASTTLLVPRQHLTRANGMIELGTSVAIMAAPAVAGVIFGVVGLLGVFVLDLTTLVLAILGLLLVRIPRVGEASSPKKSPLLRSALQGWAYVRGRPGLVALLVLFACVNFNLGMVQVLLPPLVLSFASSEVLGVILTTAGAGVLCGSALVSAWGGPERKVATIFALLLGQGLILFLGGVRPNAILVASAAFVYSLCNPIIYASSQTIWQTKVEPPFQGRAFAIRRMVAWSTLPLSYLIAGPLADRVFEPLLAVDGPLAGTVGRVIGTGEGRGIGMLFILLGISMVLVMAAGWRYRPLRELEDRLPDALERREGAGEP